MVKKRKNGQGIGLTILLYFNICDLIPLYGW